MVDTTPKKKKRKPRDKSHFIKKLLCPQHYQEQYPPQPPELLECNVCGRKLEYRCVSCQGYQDDWMDEDEATAKVQEEFDEKTKPVDAGFQYEKKKSIQEWYDQKRFNQDTEGI